MSTMSVDTSVGEWVRDLPSRSRALEKLGIDYCCGGKISLAQACAAKGLDPQAVAEQLIACPAGPPAEAEISRMNLRELADHIEATHHVYLREELPRLLAITAKVANAHGNRDPRLAEVAEIFARFVGELQEHMLKEERVLFPMVRQLELAGQPQSFHCGSLANPIRVMESDHDAAGDALKAFRRLTDHFVPPAEACNTYLVMLHALERLEADMHQHVHKENNILFPRALELESRLNGSTDN